MAYNTKLSWPLFLISTALIAYLSDARWPQRIILFVVIVGGIGLWTRWVARKRSRY